MPYIGNSPINVGNYNVLDDIASSFNGVLTTFALTINTGTSISPTQPAQLIINISNVMQEPDALGANGFTISGSNIVFSSAPVAADTFWGIFLGTTLDIGVPSELSVANAQTNFVSTSSAAGLNIKGDGTTDGTLQLNCSSNSHGVKIKSPPHSASASYTLTLPTSDGNANEVLTTNGSGVLAWSAGSTTDSTKLPLAGGTMTGTIIAPSFTSTAGGTFTTASGNDLNIVYPDSRSLFIKEAGTTHVTVDNTGNVGIGTSSPDSSLEIYKASTAELMIGSDNGGTAQISLYESNSTTKEATIKYDGLANNLVIGTSGEANAIVIPRDSGNVGIGTGSPSVKLSVVNSGAGKQQIANFANNNSGTHALYLYVDNDANQVYYKSSGTSGGGHIFETGNTERMRINSSGNVGIGTTAPTEPFSIYGNKKHHTNHGDAHHYTHVKRVSGSQPATAITFQIPATKCFLAIELFFMNTRIPGGNASTSRIGKKYFTIARYDSGFNVVLEQGYNDEWTSTTASVGGAYYTGNGDTTIVRTGSEANTATQGVKITFEAGRPTHTGGYGVLKFDILSHMYNQSGFSIT